MGPIDTIHEETRFAAPPLVSVLMPTYKQSTFIRRAIESLLAQTFADWELVIVDDGSPDNTRELIAQYLDDPRVRYRCLERNGGLGAALNLATGLARGRYIAYLPSDDVYYPEHLERLVGLLDRDPEIHLTYGGLRWAYNRYEPTLQGSGAVGREAEALINPPEPPKDARLTNGNLLALVQVLHRRSLEGDVRWATREEIISDTLERDFWRALVEQGARFGYAGAISCEWVDHPDQRHKIIAGKGLAGGLSRYRQHYGIGRGEWLNWRPTHGMRVNERARFGRFAVPRELPTDDGLKILLVGELGFNPERIMAFEERGHKLYGLWLPKPETWDTTGPLPFGNVEDIPFDRRWRERVREIRPDVIYALLNWQAVAFVGEVFDAGLDIPFVYHFKEGPFICQEKALWPTLMRVLSGSDGRIFSGQEAYEWFQLAAGGLFEPESSMVLDGDLPKIDWFTDDWAPKLSAADGEIHTVCPGRPLGLDPFEGIAAAGIHVHFYGEHFHEWFPTWTKNGLATGYMHIHPTVDPDAWVGELSRYDAAWFHQFASFNGGDLRRAHWDDLNLPARLGTYAAAGLPWILRDNRGSRVAVQSLAQQHDVGVFFEHFEDLAAQLRDHERMAVLNQNMRAARHHYAFDSHVDELLAFFRRAIARRGA
jgi:glycosyltransferase involved in cell wall biosynthesis